MIFPSTTEVIWGCAIGFVVYPVELWLARSWHRVYSTAGIPFFFRRVERASGLEGLSLDELQRISSTVWIRHLVFRRLAPGVIAFRQMPVRSFFRKRWLVRGVIRREESAPSVAVIGLLNWYQVVGTVIAMVWMRNTLWMEALIAVSFWLACRTQTAPFRRLAAALVAPASTPAGLAASRRPPGAETAPRQPA